jgi:hypothetical protein
MAQFDDVAEVLDGAVELRLGHDRVVHLRKSPLP